MAFLTEDGAGVAQVLRAPRISWYLTAYVLDCIGDFLWFITLGWVAARSANGFISGLILCSGAVPAAALMLFGGALVDRWGTSRAAIYTMTARAAVMVVWTIAILNAATPLLVLPLLAFVLGCVDGLHRPALETWPTVLATNRVQTTIFGLERLGTRAGQIIGGVSAGLLISHWSIAGPSAVASAAFLAALIMFICLSRQVSEYSSVHQSHKNQAVPKLATLAKAGVRVVHRHEVLSRTLPVHSLFNAVTAGLTFTALPIRAHQLHWSATAYGAVFAAWGAGLFVSTGTLLRVVNRIERKVSVALALVAASGCIVIVIGFVESAVLTICCAALLGLCGGPVAPCLGGYLRQQAMQTESRGSMQGVQAFALDGIEPLGFVLAGGIVATVGFSWGCAALGCLLIGCALWALASTTVRQTISF